MKIDDYFASVERSLRQNPRISKVEEPIHHPEIATHPHHKHIGPQDRLAPADQPTLSQIFDEIDFLLSQQAE